MSILKRRTSKVRHRPQVRVLQANVMSPRILWYDFLRTIGGLVRMALVLAALCAAGWGIWLGVESGLLRNKEFQLRSIVLNENPALDEIRLLEVAGIDLNGSLFQCDVAEIEARLLAMPEVRAAKVRKEFPGTLIVDVIPREPVLWVAGGSEGVSARDSADALVVDRDGVAFRCPEGFRAAARRLPVIEAGDEAGTLEAGSKVEASQFLRGLRLYRVALAADPAADEWIDSIRQAKPWASLLTTRDGIEATFGHDELERQMSDFLAAVGHAREKGDAIATIQLIGRRNLPVTFQELSAPRAIIVEEPDIIEEPSAPPASSGDEDLRKLLER